MAEELDPIIHQPTRLRIMALLFRNRQAAAAWVRAQLGLTDGNLGSHAEKLAEAGYLRVARALTPQGFQLRMSITPEGDAAFRMYLSSLRQLVLDDLAGAEAAGPPPAASKEPRSA